MRYTKLFFLFLVTASCPSFGQVLSKKKVTVEDYGNWGKLENGNLSEKGTWIWFRMNYEKREDTLFVKSTQSNKEFVFVNGITGKFGGDTVFASLDDKNNLIVTELEKGKTEILPNIKAFDYLDSGRLLFTYSQSKVLTLWTVGKKEKLAIENVTEYQIDEVSNTVSFITSNSDVYSFGIVNLKSLNVEKYRTSGTILQNLTCSEYGYDYFFLELGPGTERKVLHFYNGQTHKIIDFDSSAFSNFPLGYEIETSKSVKISQDGKRIFFGIKKREPIALSKNVEVWDTDDLQIYPKAIKDNLEYYPKLVLWIPNENKFEMITDDRLPFVRLNGSKSHALLYNPNAYAPYTTRYGDVDYFLYDIEKGVKIPFLKKQPHDKSLVSFSPNGNYIGYLKDENWWLFDIKTKEHYCITKGSGATWSSNDLRYLVRPNVFGIRGWSKDGKSLFLQDEYDVFQYFIVTKKLIKRTTGRNNNIEYAIDESNRTYSEKDNYDGWRTAVIDSGKDIIVLTKNSETKAQNYCLLSPAGKINSLALGNFRANAIRATGDRIFTYIEQTYQSAPRLICSYTGKEKIIFESNKQQNNYQWGTSELITYFNSVGKRLNGILYYPATYTPGSVYPMIVHIYSRNSQNLYEYKIPTLYDETGFNVKNYVLKDYFVLQPDIDYVEGHTGRSALDCVVAATNEVIATGMIDSKRIGLTGHSFGGYETNFIITQTEVFAAAVAGAGITDLVSWGFSVSKSLYIAEGWRSEYQQWRMGKAFYQDKSLYLENSPLYYSDKVTTPLLSWAGKQESNLPYEQVILFHNALRRAGKKNLMLLYATENHVVENKENQIDLSNRIFNWFEFYLKK